jgi:hypothetical protein
VQTIIHGFFHCLARYGIVVSDLVGRTRLGTNSRPIEDLREEIASPQKQLPVVQTRSLL